MKKKYLPLFIVLFLFSCFQKKEIVENTIIEEVEVVETETVKKELKEKYQASRKKSNILLHTKLDVSFSWEKQLVFGEATIKLRPFFYPTNKLLLDAKNFDLHKVAIIKGKDTSDLKFNYDNFLINIDLDKKYTKDEEYTIFIDYTANPNENTGEGGRTVTDSKGLYFINPMGEGSGSHQEIWTQGETEYSSCWFPTIDAPNQRCTQEIFITVENKFITLSNGILYNTLLNADSTRTDHWVMEKAHAPYLFMLAVGEYEKIEDEWQGMDVSYYVHPEYVEVARQVFDKTPEMIEFFSTIFEVEYPWAKYSQIVVDEFVSGAMENTTATVFGDFMVENSFWYSAFDKEMIIAHELAHHWFGDYVTCESWANTVLNEGFATYSEYLWTEYEYGKDEAELIFSDKLSYCFSNRNDDVVNFHYHKKDDMFGYNSYQKGAWILHNLRNYVGDQAFFDAIKIYLKRFAYKSAEIHDLRLCFEEVTGEDLNWFFNQWYFGAGYPILEIKKEFDDSQNIATVTIKQLQNTKKMPIYTLPIDFAIHLENETVNKRIMLTEEEQIFTFDLSEKPLLIEIDPNRFLLCKRKEEKLTANEQKTVLDRSTGTWAKYDALIFFENYTNDDIKREALTSILDSDYWWFRQKAIFIYEEEDNETDKIFIEKLKTLQHKDPRKEVREAAEIFLSKV